MDGITDVDDHLDDASDAEDVVDDPSKPRLHLDRLYSTPNELRDEVKAIAAIEGWTVGIKKRDSTRLILHCRTTRDCPWYLYSVIRDNGVKITSFRPRHTCHGASQPKRPEASYIHFLVREVPKLMHVDKKTSTADIRDLIRERWNTEVDLQQCWRLKSRLANSSRTSSPQLQGTNSTGTPSSTLARREIRSTSSDPDVDLFQMRLLVHFDDHTRSTLVFGPAVWKACIGLALQVLFRLQIPDYLLTFFQNQFLMRAILMTAAAHLSYDNPESEQFKTAELQHLAAASAGLRQNLALRSDAANLQTVSNVETVFPVCILLMKQTWSSFDPHHESNYDISPSIDADLLVHLGSGFRQFITDTPTRNDLFSSQIFGKVSRFSPKVQFIRFLEDCEASHLPTEFEREFDAEYRRIWFGDSVENITRLQIYIAECKRLTPLLSILELERRNIDISSLEEAIVRYVFTWPMLLSPEFMELMKVNAPCVPLLFWHFYRTVQSSVAGRYWWVQRRTDFMVESLGRKLQENGIEARNMLSRSQ